MYRSIGLGSGPCHATTTTTTPFKSNPHHSPPITYTTTATTSASYITTTPPSLSLHTHPPYQSFNPPFFVPPPHAVFLFLGNPIALRAFKSPSANHLLAFTSCTTLIICLSAMTGKLTPASTQGQKLSILLARASSRAPALCVLAKMCLSRDELTCAPWWIASAAWW